MGTNKVDLYALLIFQVVVITSAAPGGPQIFWNDITADHGGDSGNQFFFVDDKKPMGNVRPVMLNQLDSDDVNEMQIPAPPTENSAPAPVTLTFTRSDAPTEFTNTDSGAVHSGAGNLDINEISRDNGYFTQQTNSVDDKEDPFNTQVRTGGKSYSYPELNKAVEDAVNHLPTTNESPLTPLIRVFSERVNEGENDNNKQSREHLFKQSFDKMIILKLARKVEEQSTYNKMLLGNPSSPEPRFLVEQQAEGEGNPNDSENKEPCDCDGGCFQVVPMDQIHPNSIGGEQETPQVQNDPSINPEIACENDGGDQRTVQSQGEQSSASLEEQSENAKSANVHPKLVAHIVVRIRKSNPEDTHNNPNMPTPLSINSLIQPFQSQPNTLESVPRINMHSIEVSPQPADLENNNVQPRDRMVGNECDPCDENPNGESNDDLSFNRFSGLVRNVDERSGEYKELTSTPSPRLMTHDLGAIAPERSSPRDLILVNLLHNILKQKALYNAIKETRPSLPPSPEALRRMMDIENKDEAPPSALPLHFPATLPSGVIKRIDHFSLSPNSEEPATEVFNNAAEGRGISTKTEEKPTGSNRQEFPWFIRNIIESIGRHGGIQPTLPSPTSHPEGQVMLRAIMAPFNMAA